MSYVVYEKESTKRIDKFKGGPDRESFETESAAKAARTRFLKKNKEVKAEDILIAESAKFYAEIEKTIEEEGVAPGTGAFIKRKRKANEPWCCNPLSETYWSM